MKLTVLDLFSGIGGFSLGLERAGMETVAFCEQDKICQQVLKKNWPDIPIFSDVKTLNKKLLEKSNINKVDIITAGFPCQDVSSMNTNGKGLEGEKSGLWKEAKRLIKELQPKYALIENVANLRSRGLARVLKDLWSIGYDCEWHILPASIFSGSPHQRERIWILAYPSRTRLNQCKPNGTSSKPSTIVEHYLSLPILQDGAEGLEKCQNKNLSTGKKEIETQGLLQTEGARHCGNDIEELNRHWKTEPSISRMVDGLPKKLVKANNQRIKQLGNTVVPQIPELIGKAILHYERNLAA
jgi:DNA (cytosine-5)-methyltransferase 1